LPGLRLSLRHVNRETIRTIIGFSSYAIVLHSSGMLILYSDSIVIGALLPISSVTFFAIAASLTEYARTVLSGISQTLTPMASATEAASPDAVSALLRRSVRLGTLVVLPIVVTFLVRGPSFISLWMGPEYRAVSGEVLRILGLALCFAASYQIVSAAMLGLNRHRTLAFVYLAEGGVNLALSLVLARPFGVVGVALGTAIPRLIAATYFGPGFALKAVGIPRAVFAREAWLRPMTAMVPFGLISAAIERFWPAPSLPLYFSQVAIALPAAFVGAWVVALNEEERRSVRVWLGGRLKRLAGRTAG
jgi:O-antigen/teichoic acid export membrane protein